MESTFRTDHYFNSAAERSASQASVGAGETATERDTGDVYLRITTGWLLVGAGGAQHVVSVNSPALVVVNGSSGNAPNAIAAATLAATAGKTTHLTGFSVTGSGATGATAVLVTVTGVLGGTMTYVYAAAAGALLINTPIHIQFSRPIPASAVNTAIIVTVPALGVGNIGSCAVANGYQL